MSVSIEVRDQVVTMFNEGYTAGKIAQALKVKKVIVQSVIDELPLTDIVNDTITLADTNVIVVPSEEEIVVVDDAKSKRDAKLQALLGAAKVQAEVIAEVQKPASNSTRQRVTLIKVPVSSSKDENGFNVQRRNTSHPVRQVAVFTSATLNACFISTNLAYCTKTNAGAIAHAKRDLKPQKMIQPLLAAHDLTLTLSSQEVVLGDVNVAKAAAFDEYLAKGYMMLCVRPNVSVPANA